MRRMIQDVTTGDEKVAMFSAYQREEINAVVARVFLGEQFETMQTDAEEIKDAIDDDTSDLVQ